VANAEGLPVLGDSDPNVPSHSGDGERSDGSRLND
jgi:hypothetical protein